MKFGRGAAPCGSLRPARFRGSPVGLFRPRARCFGWGFLHSVPDCRAVRSNSESSCKAASGGCPGGLGVSTETTSSMLMQLVAFPLGFLGEGSLWGSSSYETGGPYGPSLRTIPRLRSEPHARMTESTPDSKPHQRRQELTIKKRGRLDRTRCPQRTVPAPATISGALPGSSCNFAGVSQR